MKNTEILKRLLGYLKAYRLRLVLVLAAAVISTAFMVLAPFLVGKVTTTLFASIADGVLSILLGNYPVAAGSAGCTLFDFAVVFFFTGIWNGKNHCKCDADHSSGP